MDTTDHAARIERATFVATEAAGDLVEAVMATDTLPPAAALAVLETIATLSAALQTRGSLALALLGPTNRALAEVRRQLLAEHDLEHAATGADKVRHGRGPSRRPATGPDTAEEWADRGEMAIAETIWFYDRYPQCAAERARFMALPIAAKGEAVSRRGTMPWPALLDELAARHQ